MTDPTKEPRCIKCGRSPVEIPEYRDVAADDGVHPNDYVRSEEGTYNPASGHFFCTECYIEVGMPLGVAP